eukprot:gb/GEZN01007296.1/.p1 GENE.gb/GEZN01007296.1/~~gb/GEZN01007296.1/.p1  ORF type:complete len:428 (+),score=42.89 gb/GEZN01007296.1/:140-1423(+)
MSASKSLPANLLEEFSSVSPTTKTDVKLTQSQGKTARQINVLGRDWPAADHFLERELLTKSGIHKTLPYEYSFRRENGVKVKEGAYFFTRGLLVMEDCKLALQTGSDLKVGKRHLVVCGFHVVLPQSDITELETILFLPSHNTIISLDLESVLCSYSKGKRLVTSSGKVNTDLSGIHSVFHLYKPELFGVPLPQETPGAAETRSRSQTEHSLPQPQKDEHHKKHQRVMSAGANSPLSDSPPTPLDDPSAASPPSLSKLHLSIPSRSGLAPSPALTVRLSSSVAGLPRPQHRHELPSLDHDDDPIKALLAIRITRKLTHYDVRPTHRRTDTEPADQGDSLLDPHEPDPQDLEEEDYEASLEASGSPRSQPKPVGVIGRVGSGASSLTARHRHTLSSEPADFGDVLLAPGAWRDTFLDGPLPPPPTNSR